MTRLFLFLFLLPLVTTGQSKEFEGEIHYLHLFQFKQPGLDSAALIRDFGSNSKYYYKNGSYRWTFYTSNIQEEYHNAASGITYNKYKHTDTLLLTEDSQDDTLLRYEIIKNADTICGYVCDKLSVLTGNKNNKEALLIREIFFTRELPVDPEHFRNFKTYCANEVYKITGAVPLRIDMDTPYWPFKICFLAIKVNQRPLDSKEIAVPSGVILGRRN